jgi:tRNA G10  N-methylase Trm11
MGYNTYGTDLEPRMIDYSNQNIAWLRLHAKPVGTIVTEIGDATTHHWQQPVDYIAAETYLGKPLTRIPQQHELMDIVQSVNTLHKKVLANIHGQITPSTRICLAVPAWRTPKGFMHLPVLDQLDKLGYNQLVFSHTNARNLIYARADQIVARQLVVLQKQ